MIHRGTWGRVKLIGRGIQRRLPKECYVTFGKKNTG